MLKIGHSVTHPGRNLEDEPVTIDVPQELETAPGIVQNPQEVDFYSREYPLEAIVADSTADIKWLHSVLTEEMSQVMTLHAKLNKPIMDAAKDSGDIEPTAEPVPGVDVTQEIKRRAKELGFAEVGITRFDMRYVFKSKRHWVKFPHAICLAYEQDYEKTQSAPSLAAEGPHFGLYRVMGALALDLADDIRSLGYHVQVHNPNNDAAPVIPMFVDAGIGQVGANGQLLSPYFGSRARAHDHDHGCPGDLRQAYGLRHARLLLHLPGVR